MQQKGIARNSGVQHRHRIGATAAAQQFAALGGPEKRLHPAEVVGDPVCFSALAARDG
jgi:hypothetical protein